MSGPNPGSIACYPLNLAAQQAWHDARFPAPAAHPEPEVPSRLASPEEMRACRAAGTVRKLARAHGWRVNPTYARGWSIGTARTPSRLVESIALRLRRVDELSDVEHAACAVWSRPANVGKGYTFELARFWSVVDRAFPFEVNANVLRALLATGDRSEAIRKAEAGEPVLPIFTTPDELVELRLAA